MNISSHSVLPNKFMSGQRLFDGTLPYPSTSTKATTHWFPLSISNLSFFLIPSNWISLYGLLRLRYDSSSSTVLNPYQKIPYDGVLFDSTDPILPSKPFSIILY